MLLASQACIVLTDDRVHRLLGQAIDGARPRLGCQRVGTLRRRYTTGREEPVTPEALALVQFSSGSTVDPKPVALTHQNLTAMCQALKTMLVAPRGVDDTGVCWLPLYHDMGLIGCLLFAAYYPGNLVLISPQDFLARPALWLRALARHEACFSAGPNFAYGVCEKRIKDEDLEGLNLEHWQAALCGAEPISASTLQRFNARFARFGLRPDILMPVYGLSEASLAVTFTPPRGLRTLIVDPDALGRSGEAQLTDALFGRELVSVGSPIPGVELQVRDGEGKPLPERKQGRIYVRGPSVMGGYFGATEATARALQNGWLDTGDLGFHHEGELYLTGRAKDLVIIRGANHAPQEFEDCLYDVAGVRTGCAVALGFFPPGQDEEALLILAERGREQVERLEDRIREVVMARTGVRPHTVELLTPGTLPRTSSGKLRRQEALQQYLSGELRPPRDVTALTLGWEAVLSSLAFARSRRPS
jgi:acyl-CoA synthetase (AMP-forming)/AMP-acid ligase II